MSDKFCLILFFSICVLGSCDNAKIPRPTLVCDEVVTYSNQVNSIIVNSCATSGCHDGSAPGLFDSYSSMLPLLTADKFEARVSIQQDMPPVGSEVLTEEDLKTLKCWIQDGYPE